MQSFKQNINFLIQTHRQHVPDELINPSPGPVQGKHQEKKVTTCQFQNTRCVDIFMPLAKHSRHFAEHSSDTIWTGGAVFSVSYKLDVLHSAIRKF